MRTGLNRHLLQWIANYLAMWALSICCGGLPVYFNAFPIITYDNKNNTSASARTEVK